MCFPEGVWSIYMINGSLHNLNADHIVIHHFGVTEAEPIPKIHIVPNNYCDWCKNSQNVQNQGKLISMILTKNQEQ